MVSPVLLSEECRALFFSAGRYGVGHLRCVGPEVAALCPLALLSGASVAHLLHALFGGNGLAHSGIVLLCDVERCCEGLRASLLRRLESRCPRAEAGWVGLQVAQCPLEVPSLDPVLARAKCAVG
jgi:hypothetical protein